MAQRQPIELVIAKGKKHLTKAEIEKRRAEEIAPLEEGIEAPAFLTKKEREEFDKIAAQLKELHIMSATDCDTLARYIKSKGLYIKLTKQAQKPSVINDPKQLDAVMKNQDRAFRQCHQCAAALGLTITSRCKLSIPRAAESEQQINKFARFMSNG